MDHTYLRYECADSFSLCVASGSSKAPQSNNILRFLGAHKSSPLLTIGGSQLVGTNLKTSEQVLQIGHREQLSGGVGTGKALNSDEVVCLDVCVSSEDGSAKVATGWIDGTVRVFDLEADEVANSHHGLAHSLIEENDDEDFVQRQPLLLKGHDSPVRAITWDHGHDRLASGSSDGSIVLWDTIAESGLFRLIGHRGGITNIHFCRLDDAGRSCDLLITSSLDGLVKVWDLNDQCCTQTIASHRGEVWGSACLPVYDTPGTGSDEPTRWRLVTGGIEGRAKVWSVQPSKRSKDTIQDESETKEDSNLSQVNQDDCCYFMGQLIPPPNVSTSSEKITCIHYHPSGRYVGILQSGSKGVDIYAVRSTKEAHKKRQRRLKRRKEKQSKRTAEPAVSGTKHGILDDPVEAGDQDSDEEQGPEEALDPELICASDEFEFLTTLRGSHKVRGFSFFPSKEKGELCRVVCALSSNSLEVITARRGDDGKGILTDATSLDRSGHPTGIRSISLSSDDKLAFTISKSVVKVWNVANRSVIQSLQPSVLSSNSKGGCYGLCGTFLPGNNHVVVGTREGHLITIDISSGEVIDAEENAHDGAIWSIDVQVTGRGSPVSLITGSADKSVKFWDIEADEETDTPLIVHSRTLRMTDDVVAVKCSNSINGSKRMVFVSTLDSTVKVFFADSLKLFLNLYGHKLPALALDASDDDTLLATAGADKTIKLWGLDFGDTHRTLHGHLDSITDLRFVRQSHNFFSASKDGTVRYWDGDRFEQILLLNGHCSEVSSLALSRSGAFLLSGGMDRQVRVWERTEDIVFLEEERERELESKFEMIGRDDGGTADILGRHNDGDDGDKEQEPQSEAAVKKSVLSVSSGDRIMEAIEKADTEIKEITVSRLSKGAKERAPNPLLFGLTPARYILWVLRSIPAADLEQSLLILSLNHIERLVFYLISLLKEGRGVELCSRAGIFLIKAHQNQIISNRNLSIPIRELRRVVRTHLTETLDVIGYDLAAMRSVASIAAQKRQTSNVMSLPENVWAGMGLGSDVAAALEATRGRKTSKP